MTLNHLQSVYYSTTGTFEFKTTVVPEAAEGLEVRLRDCVCRQVTCQACLQGYNWVQMPIKQ